MSKCLCVLQLIVDDLELFPEAGAPTAKSCTSLLSSHLSVFKQVLWGLCKESLRNLHIPRDSNQAGNLQSINLVAQSLRKKKHRKP